MLISLIGVFFKHRDKLNKPHCKLVKCGDRLCAAIHSEPCADPDEQCDYEVEYADQGSSLGVLVLDNIALKFTSGSLARPILAGECFLSIYFTVLLLIPN